MKEITNADKKSKAKKICTDLVVVRNFQRELIAQTNLDLVPVVGVEAGKKVDIFIWISFVEKHPSIGRYGQAHRVDPA